MDRFEVLAGLPSTGPLPRWIPESWRKSGREGYVVRFFPSHGDAWVGNFKPGIDSAFGVYPHPDGSRLLVVSGGDLYAVDVDTGVVNEMDQWASQVLELSGSTDLVMELSGLAFYRLGAEGVVWHTRRISWDGFRSVRIDDGEIRGEAWSIENEFVPFCVDVRTGRSSGGPQVPDSYKEVLAEPDEESS